MHNPETPEDKTPIRILLKAPSEVLGCRLVVGIADEFISPQELVSIAVTSYPTDDTEGKMIDSFVIELMASKVIDKMKEGTFLSYIEGAAMAKETFIASSGTGADSCRH